VAEPSFYGGDSAEQGPGSGVSGDTAAVPVPATGGFSEWEPGSCVNPHPVPGVQGPALLGLGPWQQR